MTRTRLTAPRTAALALAASALVLAACGTTEDPVDGTGPDSDAGAGGATEAPDAGTATSGPADADDPDGEAAAGGPVTYTDARGEHTLDAPATDVVVLEWGFAENLVALGVDPIGLADVAGYNAWVQVAPVDEATTTDVGMRGEPSLSAITTLDPDLIVSTTTIPESTLAQLEEIAPVLALPGSEAEDPIGYMEETVTTLGAVTGTDAEAEQVLADFDAALEEGRAAVAEAGLEGEPFVFADGYETGGTVSLRIYTEGSYFGAIAEELGLVNAWTEGGGDPAYGLAPTDVEGLTSIGDAAFFYGANDVLGDVFADSLADNPIWEQLPFVTAGTVYRLEDGVWPFGGPVSGTAFVDALVTTLQE